MQKRPRRCGAHWSSRGAGNSTAAALWRCQLLEPQLCSGQCLPSECVHHSSGSRSLHAAVAAPSLRSTVAQHRASSALTTAPADLCSSPSTHLICLQNGLAEAVQKSRKQIKERKNRSKPLRGVKKAGECVVMCGPGLGVRAGAGRRRCL